MKVYSVKIENLEYNICDALPFLSEERKYRIKKMRQTSDQIRSIVAETMIRLLIMREYNIKNKKIRLSFNDYGKPFLEGVPNFNFNLSHSGSYILCSTSKHPVGIDVEKVNHINLDVAKHFFTKEEIAFINKADTGIRVERFYSIWTAKESYIKFLGRGLSVPLTSFGIKIDNNSISISNEEFNQKKHFPCYFKSYDKFDKYKVTLCSKSHNQPDAIYEIEYNKLFEEFMKLVYRN
ncbi:4'-phosphopantetheinyl transferase family protein [Virgibacillus saliphilus]|uniref:4'-phosphopantetheinyl transferase family protein n=1 Tax=Virgibacillus saliphilus TaxID=2831674 RepID=UPI00281583B7|nr:4'-phosphopantetheinyl transferase superfamily protein [Virgibacillus sp. NKC19-3]